MGACTGRPMRASAPMDGLGPLLLCRGGCPHPPAAPAPARDSQRQRKKKQINATTAPTRSAPSATGRQLQESQKRIACPKAGPNRRLHRSADPVVRRATAPERVKAIFSLPSGAAHSLFVKNKYGAPAAARAVGKGEAREREQFSPQAETKLSGLCDDAMGAHPLWEQPLREQGSSLR